MRQIVQNLKTGVTEVIEVPRPCIEKGKLQIETLVSLISPGTERMLVEFSQANIFSKAKQQPEKVAQVLNKVKSDGILTTFEAVKSKLDQPISMGYCNVGVVVDAESSEFPLGQRIVSNSAHSEIVNASPLLCASIPDNVNNEEASFTILGAIALQGLRIISPTLGEKFVVFGLGVIGLLTVQLLKANGCSVLGVDYDREKIELAKSFGAETCDLSLGESPIDKGALFCQGDGVDGVIIATSSDSDEIISQAAQLCRKLGRIVLVGVAGLNLNRSDFYEKEITFQVSCSYGPGRYDPNYENKGIDYPIGYVRWTQNRNFKAFLELLSSGVVNVKPLISKRVSFENAEKVYTSLSKGKLSLGIILNYDRHEKRKKLNTISFKSYSNIKKNVPVIGLIGAGNYASRILIPAIKSNNTNLHTIVSVNGTNASIVAKKFGFCNASSDVDHVLENPDINTVVVATRHDTHAELVCRALEAGKNVFVEKPLALNHSEIDEIKTAYYQGVGKLMVGFNRRFSSHVEKANLSLSIANAPKVFTIVVNAGNINKESWVHDPKVGGGRILGEACHHVDLMRFMAKSTISSVNAIKLGINNFNTSRDDNVLISLNFEDGTIGSILYTSIGGKAYPKEKIDIFFNNSTIHIDNFKKMTGYNVRNLKNSRLLRQDKGTLKCISEFLNCVRNNTPEPIPIEETFEVSHKIIEINDLLQKM